ncbi:hypothetical protein [Kineosporia sp. A_224]|uniref:hypothetical protein n=1 Tax=Kineosporia sp. A_224 TaxID=1962180 RepID=UPI000B4AAE1F|nr:hypothetical protein [Kineosporia sp. A_224]
MDLRLLDDVELTSDVPAEVLAAAGSFALTYQRSVRAAALTRISLPGIGLTEGGRPGLDAEVFQDRLVWLVQIADVPIPCHGPPGAGLPPSMVGDMIAFVDPATFRLLRLESAHDPKDDV